MSDDLFGDLHYSGTSLPAIKSFDSQGRVLYCSSVSKSLGSGFRIGWTCPGRYFEAVKSLKAFRNIGEPLLSQMVVAEFMDSGYERHLKALKKTFARQHKMMTDLIYQAFPRGTYVYPARGGHVLWLTLPDQRDSLLLYERARSQGITFFPGKVFSTTGKYNSSLSLNVAIQWDDTTRQAILTLGRLAGELSGSTHLNIAD